MKNALTFVLAAASLLAVAGATTMTSSGLAFASAGSGNAQHPAPRGLTVAAAGVAR